MNRVVGSYLGEPRWQQSPLAGSYPEETVDRDHRERHAQHAAIRTPVGMSVLVIAKCGIASTQGAI
jgi:hypothetical protein